MIDILTVMRRLPELQQHLLLEGREARGVGRVLQNSTSAVSERSFWFLTWRPVSCMLNMYTCLVSGSGGGRGDSYFGATSSCKFRIPTNSNSFDPGTSQLGESSLLIWGLTFFIPFGRSGVGPHLFYVLFRATFFLPFPVIIF